MTQCRHCHRQARRGQDACVRCEGIVRDARIAEAQDDD